MNHLPPHIPNETAQKAADEVRALEAERAKAVTERDRLERRRGVAVEEDRQSLAAALRAGRADPGPKAVEKADAAAEKARRREAALGTAVGQARAELGEAVSENREQLEATAAERVAEARERYGAAVEQIVAEHRALSEALGFAAWLKGGPEARYMPAKHTPGVRSLTTPSGSPPSFEAVTEALGELAEPLRPAQPAGRMPNPDAAQAA